MVKKIIIFEDNSGLRKGLEELLQLTDEFVVIASYDHCLQAEQHIKTDMPDVVLMDIDMPDMDGLTLARQIRASGHRMPLVMLSSNPFIAREAGKDVAWAAILQKPLLRADLYRHLQALSVPASAPAGLAAPPACSRRPTASPRRTSCCRRAAAAATALRAIPTRRAPFPFSSVSPCLMSRNARACGSVLRPIPHPCPNGRSCPRAKS